jgi:class 3 adenylate cyclase
LAHRRVRRAGPRVVDTHHGDAPPAPAALLSAGLIPTRAHDRRFESCRAHYTVEDQQCPVKSRDIAYGRSRVHPWERDHVRPAVPRQRFLRLDAAERDRVVQAADAEDVMALLRDYHAAIGEIIIKYNGTLERYAGDGGSDRVM